MNRTLIDRLRIAAVMSAWAVAMVLTLMCMGCGGGDEDPDAELRQWCASFVGPLTPDRQAECERVRGTP